MVAFEPVVCVSEIERTAVATDALGASQALAELSADDALGAAQVTLDDDAIVLNEFASTARKSSSIAETRSPTITKTITKTSPRASRPRAAGFDAGKLENIVFVDMEPVFDVIYRDSLVPKAVTGKTAFTIASEDMMEECKKVGVVYNPSLLDAPGGWWTLRAIAERNGFKVHVLADQGLMIGLTVLWDSPAQAVVKWKKSPSTADRLLDLSSRAIQPVFKEICQKFLEPAHRAGKAMWTVTNEDLTSLYGGLAYSPVLLEHVARSRGFTSSALGTIGVTFGWDSSHTSDFCSQ